VLLDDVQYPKKGGSWMNRARILAGGEPAWITVPLDRSFHGIRQVREMRIDVTKPWREGIVSRIAAGYSRAAHRDEVLPVVEELLSTSADRIAELNERAIRRLAPELGLDASKLVRQSDLGVTGSATELIVSLCRAVNGDAYLTGDGANGYLELRPFEDAGIELLYQRFVPPRYPQPAAEYVAGLSVVDLLMNCGWAGARALLVPSPQASV
jgi:WbqC-like protein family